MIHACPWSDHHVVSFQTSYVGLTPQTATWRLNDYLLTDPNVIREISNTPKRCYIRSPLTIKLYFPPWNLDPLLSLIPGWNSLSLPSLMEEEVWSLYAPWSEQEILYIIKSLKTSKAPGPDGYTPVYYRKFVGILTPKLSSFFIYILQGNKPPEEMLHTNMTLIR